MIEKNFHKHLIEFFAFKVFPCLELIETREKWKAIPFLV